MKNSILNLGKALNKAEQKSINGGLTDQDGPLPTDSSCSARQCAALPMLLRCVSHC